jgi:predicted CoA-substrate-specific enzyme activase
LAYAGCDLGIATAKIVIVENSQIIASEVLPYTNLPRQAATNVMHRALEMADIPYDQIDCCLSTGFGKKAVPYVDGIIPDTVCILRAVQELNQKIKTVIDVGASSFNAFSINNSGWMSETTIQNKCAEGNGLFIDLMVKALRMPLDELTRGALNSQNPVRITSQCAILAESDVVSHLNDGHNAYDVFAGVANSISNRIAALVRQVGAVEEVLMIGGVAKNAIVVRELEKELGLRLADPFVDHQVFAAFGAALAAEDQSTATPEKVRRANLRCSQDAT